MNRRAVFYLLLVFVLGVAFGAVGAYLGDTWNVFDWHRRSHDREHGVVDWLSRELALSPDQQGHLQTILEDAKKLYQQVWERQRAESEQVRQTVRQRIREILTEEQKPQFEELLGRIDERRRQRAQRYPRKSDPGGTR